MDVKPEHEDNTVENDTERKTPEDPSNEKYNTYVTVSGNEKEADPAKMAAPDHEESVQAVLEFSLEDDSGNGPHGVTNVNASEHKVSEVNEQPASTEDGAVFEINSSHYRGHHRLNFGFPQTETGAPAQEEEGNEEQFAADPGHGDLTLLLQELCEERDKAVQHSSQVQRRLHEYLRMQAEEDAQQNGEVRLSEQLQESGKYISILTELRQQQSGTAQQLAEELRFQSQEKLDEVENEWQAFMAMKRDVGETLLSRSLGKQAAQAKIESALAAEQLRQDQLIRLRIKHIKLRAQIQRLEGELQEEDDRSRDPLQLEFELLQAERQEQKKLNEKQREESLKLQKKTGSILELLSNIKEKLYWSQMEVQAKLEELADLESAVARKRDHLTKTKQVCNSLQRDNQRLKEHRGLLGNRVLLQNFEDTVDAADHLKAQLENLKSRQAEIRFSRWKKTERT